MCAARWPISGLGCQWRGLPMFRTVTMEIHTATAMSRVHAASLIGFLMAVSFCALAGSFLELLLPRQAPDIPAMWRRISRLRLNPKSHEHARRQAPAIQAEVGRECPSVSVLSAWSSLREQLRKIKRIVPVSVPVQARFGARFALNSCVYQGESG